MSNQIRLELYPYEYLRVVRCRLNMTQAELARRLGIARQVVSYYENGIFQIPQQRLETIRQLAEQES
jgi:transcriptional regulator with XRE-family HTH domain